MNDDKQQKCAPRQYRIAMTGGGSGGHVYPALALLQRLEQFCAESRCRKQPDVLLEVLWLGSRDGIEKELLAQYSKKLSSKYVKLEYCGISCGKLRRYFSWKNFSDLFRIVAGLWQSYWQLRHKRPQLLFSKGGFVTVPGVVAARLLGIATFAHESDLDPGLATRLALPWVQTLFLPYEQSRKYYPARYQNKLIVSGNPVRAEFFAEAQYETPGEQKRKGEGSRRKIPGAVPPGLLPAAWLNEDDLLRRPLLLVLGGSLGAQELNNYLRCWLTSDLCEKLEPFYILHQCGQQDYPELTALERKYTHYRVEPFIAEGLAQLYQLCRRSTGLVLSRAGAGSLWEIRASGCRAVLLPLQSGSRGDQLRNARLFAEQGWAWNFVAEPPSSFLRISGGDPQNIQMQRNSRDLLEQICRILHDGAGPVAGAVGPQVPDAALSIARNLWQKLCCKADES